MRGCRKVSPHPTGPIFSISCSFHKKKSQMIGWCPTPSGKSRILDFSVKIKSWFECELQNTFYKRILKYHQAAICWSWEQNLGGNFTAMTALSIGEWHFWCCRRKSIHNSNFPSSVKSSINGCQEWTLSTHCILQKWHIHQWTDLAQNKQPTKNQFWKVNSCLSIRGQSLSPQVHGFSQLPSKLDKIKKNEATVMLLWWLQIGRNKSHVQHKLV